MSIISATITIEQFLGGQVDVTCNLTNTSKDDYDLLSWHTPLNGRAEFWNMMKVTFKDTKEVICYDGLNVKRGKPTIDDYVLIKAGETIELTFSLTDSYRIKKTGDYEILLDTIILDAAKTSSKLVPRAQKDYHPIELKSNTISVDLDKKSPPTIAENYITDTKLVNQFKVGPATSGTHAKLKPATFDSKFTDADKKKQVAAAHEAAYVWAKAAALRLSDDDHFSRWFGKFDEGKQKTLLSDFKQIVEHMETKFVSYKDNASLDAYGQVTGNGPKWKGPVELGKLFWTANPLGLDSQAGTIIHELSHAIDRTSDLVQYWYSPEASKDLAQISSEYSIMHADSLEYFAETIFVFKNQWLQGSKIINIGDGDPAKDYQTHIEEVSPTAKSYSRNNKMIFSTTDGKFQIVVSDGPDTIKGTLSEDFRIIEWDHKKWGSPSLQVVAGADHYGAIEVSGAGTEDANGVYQPINRADLPLDAPNYTSKLMWRHTKNKELVIVHTDECWWISHYKDCTRDLYIINDSDPLMPPVNGTWTPCAEDDDNSWDVGLAPAPTVKFGLMWAAKTAL